jgi:hypothetical protein
LKDPNAILRLPVNEEEEPHLMSFYVRQAFGHGRVDVQHMGVLFAHLMYHAKIVEAECVDLMARKYGGGGGGGDGGDYDSTQMEVSFYSGFCTIIIFIYMRRN